MTKKKHPSKTIDSTFRYIHAIDKHIKMGMITIDIIHSLVVVDSYTHLYYSRPYPNDPDKMYKGFCQMIRLWINYQRSVKLGDLMRMVEDGDFDHITTRELEDRKILSNYTSILPHPIKNINLPTDDDINSIRQFHIQYIQETYRPLADNDPIYIVAIDTKGRPFVVIHEEGIPSQLIRQKP